MLRPALLVSMLVPCVLSVAACAAESGGGDSVAVDDPEQTGAVKILESKLYADPRSTPNPGCDRFTSLTLWKGRNDVLTAKLEDKLSPTSGCEILVAPNPRSFVVTTSASCGSTIYEGTKGAKRIRVQDNRSRGCEDLRPATIEVEEQEGARTTALFGEPLAGGGGGGGGGAAPVSKVLDVKLYPAPKATPSPGCDRYTKLAIGKEGSTILANVREELSPTSGCEVLVVPNDRRYELTASESCGSKIYDSKGGTGRLHVEDHRTRMCEDLRADVVEVQESRGGRTVSLFGKP